MQANKGVYRTMRSAKKTKSAKKMGNDAEKHFVSVAKSKGYEVSKSTKKQDMVDHFDYLLKNKKGLTKTFEVKALKKVNRTDDSTNNEWIWIEIKNVRGEKGWIKGKADFVSFEQEFSFLTVKREDLLELCRTLIDTKKTVGTANEAEYCLYSRRGRKDIISRIKVQDIKDGIKHWIWDK